MFSPSAPSPLLSLVCLFLVCFRMGRAASWSMIYTSGAPLQLFIYPLLPSLGICSSTLCACSIRCLFVPSSLLRRKFFQLWFFVEFHCQVQVQGLLRFVSAAPNTSPDKRRWAAVNVSVHLCKEWCNGAIFQPFFLVFLNPKSLSRHYHYNYYYSCLLL